MPIDCRYDADGLNNLEAGLNGGLVLVTLLLWGLFIASLFAEKGGHKRFAAVLILHSLALAIALVETNVRVFWQCFSFGSLGGVALILGVAHHHWPPGARLKPRLWTALGVVLALAAMLVFAAPRTPA